MFLVGDIDYMMDDILCDEDTTLNIHDVRLAYHYAIDELTKDLVNKHQK